MVVFLAFLAFKCIIGDIVPAIVEQRKKLRELDLVQVRLNEERLKVQVSINYDDNIKRIWR